MKPTSTWICDSCGAKIESVEHGWVEWLSKYEDGKTSARGLRLVHHVTHSPRKRGGCQYDGGAEHARDGMTISDLPLSRFTGPDGLMDLLALVAEGALPQRDVLEMIKRIHVPGYEHARLHFESAIAAGAFEPNTPKGFYRSSDIEATLAHAKANRT